MRMYLRSAAAVLAILIGVSAMPISADAYIMYYRVYHRYHHFVRHHRHHHYMRRHHYRHLYFYYR